MGTYLIATFKHISIFFNNPSQMTFIKNNMLLRNIRLQLIITFKTIKQSHLIVQIACVNTVTTLNHIILLKTLTLNSTSILSLCFWIISLRNGDYCSPTFSPSFFTFLINLRSFHSEFCLCIHTAFPKEFIWAYLPY